MDRKYELQYLPDGDLQMWTVEKTVFERDDAIRAAEELVSSGEKHVRVVYSKVWCNTPELCSGSNSARFTKIWY
jgi:hypothetical protein